MSMLPQDLRFGFRTLMRSPLYTTAALLVLALGIGANAAIFSLVQAVVLKPLPYPAADQLVMLWTDSELRGRETVTPEDYEDWRRTADSFRSLAAYCLQTLNLTAGGDLPERLEGASVTSDFFDTLGVRPALGPGFGPGAGSAAAGRERVAVIGHGLWTQRFEADPGVLGRQIVLDGISHTIAGVMPEGFTYPEDVAVWVEAPRQIPVLQASDFNAPEKNYKASYLRVLGRLAPGVSLASAQGEMDSIAARQQRERADREAALGVQIITLHEELVGDVRTPLLLLLGAVGFVLLIACANVANLSLARAGSRGQEMVLRRALGAGRWRLVRQLLTESSLLAFVAGCLGLVLGAAGAKLLALWLGALGIPRVDSVHLDLTVLLFTLGISVLAGICFGILPALRVSLESGGETLRSQPMRVSEGKGSRLWQNLLVITELAVVAVLLVGAGLMLKSILQLQKVDTGFQAQNTVSVKVFLPGQKYPEGHQRAAFFHDLVQRVGALPGVQKASAVLTPPMGGDSINMAFSIEGKGNLELGERPRDGYQIVVPGYFDTLQIPVLTGRAFDDRDVAAATGVAMISQSMRDRYWKGESPLGRRITYDDPKSPDARWLSIIGVVGDVRHDGLAQAGRAEVYQVHPQAPWPFLSVLARAEDRLDASTLVPSIRSQVVKLDDAQPISNAVLLEDLVDKSVADTRVTSRLLGAFAVLALILAAVGVYGVLAYGVSRRRREIGVRMALGAGRRRILSQVLREGMLLAGIGTVLGLVCSLFLARLLESLLFEVSTTDWETLILMPAVIFLVALAATFFPAYRASRVEPSEVLRGE